MLFCAARYDWLSGSNQRWCCSCSAVNVCSRAKSLNQDGVRENPFVKRRSSSSRNIFRLSCYVVLPCWGWLEKEITLNYGGTDLATTVGEFCRKIESCGIARCVLCDDNTHALRSAWVSSLGGSPEDIPALSKLVQQAFPPGYSTRIFRCT